MLLAVDAGPVLGVALVDLDFDGVDDILVGTQDGFLRAYDAQGTELLAWSAGDLALADNGSLLTFKTDEDTIVAFALAGGWRVLSIAP